jgi:CHAD domain-containing protein
MSGRIPAAPWLRHLERHVPLARAGEDPEGVHQLRVAAGRLEVWLRMRGLRVLRDDLRWLRRAASRVRDFDVLLERELPAGFRAWVERERAQAHARMVAVLDAPRVPALFAALPVLEPPSRRAGRRYLERELAVAAGRGARLLRPRSSNEHFHSLRRSLRRIRYAREWLGLDSSEVKSLQDELGALNDAAAALANLERSGMQAQLRGWRAELAREAALAREQARSAWKRAKLGRGKGKK